MKRRLTWLILSFLMALSLVLASCATTTEEEEEEEGVVVEEEEEEEEEEEGGPPATGDWWDKFGEPEYGGQLSMRYTMFPSTYDPWLSFGTLAWVLYEPLFGHDWTLDRDTFGYRYRWTPPEVCVGTLMESWEFTDPQTCVVKIRQGIHWQDKLPTYGREFTAYDVEHHYDRLLGTGSGYTEITPHLLGFIVSFEKVTATDKYTAEFKFKDPAYINSLMNMFDPISQNIEAPEMVPENLFSDWRNVATTGPFIITDYVASSSMTLTRNPNYWAYDERHPENQLPYVDRLNILNIPDLATAIAALRTGKVDIMDEVSWEQTESLERTNPELQSATRPMQAKELQLMKDRAPFNDINVRKALNKAIDRETIAATYYGGTVDGKPTGLLHPKYTGWSVPYDDWPEDLKEGHSFEPERARELLAEAGYPEGFKTSIDAASNSDLEVLQIVKDMFLDVGVDMEIRVMEQAALQALARTGAIEQIYYHQSSAGHPPTLAMNAAKSTSGGTAYSSAGDTTFDAMVDEIFAAGTLEEIQSLARELDLYYARQYPNVMVCPFAVNTIWQPYLKGYSGEWIRWGIEGFYYSRLWVDQDLKKSMGR